MTNIATGPVDYSVNKTPKGYACTTCGASGVRLYREYNTFVDYSELSCTSCAQERYKKSHKGKECVPRDSDPKDTRPLNQIGWTVFAVPTPDGESYWSFGSTPQEAYDWWERLPAKKFFGWWSVK